MFPESFHQEGRQTSSTTLKYIDNRTQGFLEGLY